MYKKAEHVKYKNKIYILKKEETEKRKGSGKRQNLKDVYKARGGSV